MYRNIAIILKKRRRSISFPSNLSQTFFYSSQDWPINDTFLHVNEHFEVELEKVKEAQKEFAKFDQEKVDLIFKNAAMQACINRIPLAKLAVSETGMGLVEDKVIKNHFASEYIYNRYKNEKTCGVIETHPEVGIKKIAEPMGVLVGLIPW
jgi:acetaldehyde dehydrogenase/alcohol dehydrogenase